MAAERAVAAAKTKRVFGQPHAPAKMFRVGLYARVSTHDQKTLPLQIRTMREYAAKRGWEIAVQIKEVGFGFVSLTEALDLTTPTGRAMAGLLSVFAEFEHEILRERIRAGIAEARR